MCVVFHGMTLVGRISYYGVGISVGERVEEASLCRCNSSGR